MRWRREYRGEIDTGIRDAVCDVIQLIKANRLTLDYAEQLNPYVQDKFRELWQSAQVVEEY